MKIAINLLFLRPGKVGGSEVFARNLINNLLRIDKDNEYVLLVPKNTKDLLNFNTKYIELDVNNESIFKRVFFEQFILPSRLRKEKIDLLINLGNTCLLFSRLRQILVVHDLIYFVYPEYFPFIKRNYLRIMVYLSCKKADRIATISNNTKEDIIRFTKVNPDKIKIIHGGIEAKLFSGVNKEEAKEFVKEKYGLESYFYSPTSIYPHKNNSSLIKAFAKLKKEKGIDQKLIITGVDPYNKKNDLENEIKSLGMEGEVIYLGSVPFSHVPLLFKGSDIVIYLSEYEGFGLPVLEAMSAEVPVLSSNRSSLPEVVGSAGILVNPYDIVEISERLYDLVKNDRLRNECIDKGREQIKKFTWESTALKMIDIYN